jgi:hypothetical protein
MRLARDQLLCKTETESESNANSYSDTKRNAVAYTDAVTNSDTDANTEG